MLDLKESSSKVKLVLLFALGLGSSQSRFPPQDS